MERNIILDLLDKGYKLRIRTWPENFYLFKIENEFVFSNNKKMNDFSYFDVKDWEIYDESNLFFAAKCESERLNKIFYNSLEDDIIDL